MEMICSASMCEHSSPSVEVFAAVDVHSNVFVHFRSSRDGSPFATFQSQREPAVMVSVDATSMPYNSPSWCSSSYSSSLSPSS